MTTFAPFPRARTVLLIATLIMLSGFFPSSANAALPMVNWNQLDQKLETMSRDSNLLVAEFRGSSCSAIHDRNADRTLAIASTFKLYVLGELGLQVQKGEAAWDDRIELTASLRSMPSGDYAWVPAGTSVPVLDLAEAMIWQIDNTATDHLIDYLGRENVERAFASFGHSDPGLNSPLLMTRELFGIKMTQSSSWMDAYADADNARQLELLHTDIDPMAIDPNGGWGNWNGPTAIGEIEWFASASDLCRATASLWTMGAQPGLSPIRDVLSGNRGAVGELSSFPKAGYKGGYEAGVVNMTYILQREDGRVFFVSAGYNSTTSVIDPSTAVSYLIPVFDCLGSDDCIDA
ncbi:MAG: serine hydrolase, partial [Thermomicrobiales bacterium]